MKKIFFLCCLLFSTMGVMADEVQKIDAAKVSKITFKGDNVTITYNDGTTSTTFDMAVVTLDFSNVTSVEERISMTKKEGLEGKAVYDLNGHFKGNSVARLSKGVYIVHGKKVIIK